MQDCSEYESYCTCPGARTTSCMTFQKRAGIAQWRGYSQLSRRINPRPSRPLRKGMTQNRCCWPQIPGSGTAQSTFCSAIAESRRQSRQNPGPGIGEETGDSQLATATGHFRCFQCQSIWRPSDSILAWCCRDLIWTFHIRSRSAGSAGSKISWRHQTQTILPCNSGWFRHTRRHQVRPSSAYHQSLAWGKPVETPKALVWKRCRLFATAPPALHGIALPPPGLRRLPAWCRKADKQCPPRAFHGIYHNRGFSSIWTPYMCCARKSSDLTRCSRREAR